MSERQIPVQESGVQLEIVFEAMADSVFLYDTQGRIRYINPIGRRLFAIDEQPDYTSRAFHERLSHYAPRDETGLPMPPEHWPVKRVLQGEVLTGSHAADMILTTYDGRLLHTSISGAPIRDADGQVTGAVFIIRDVTERRNMERRMQESLNGLLAMAETLVHEPPTGDDMPGDGVCAANTTGTMRQMLELTRHVLNCQRVAVIAIEPETEMLRPLAIIGVEQRLEQIWFESIERMSLREYMFEVGLLASLHSGEVVIRDGRYSPLYVFLKPPRQHTILTAPMYLGNQLIGLLSLDFNEHDHQYTRQEFDIAGAAARLATLVIERERLTQEREEARASALALSEANRRMDDFLSIASHELRTPLTSIKGNVQLAERKMAKLNLFRSRYPQELAREHDFVHSLLERTDRQTELINRLVGDLLDVSRIQSDKFELHMELRDLASIARDVVYEQRIVVHPREIIFEQLPESPDTCNTPVSVLVDADRIGQVMANYITNALKFSDPGSPITVRLDVQNGIARIGVHDEGPGLSEDEQAHIWERFYQSRSIAVKNGSSVGLGLGLHICRTIINRHGGDVGVQSFPEKGVTFWFTLPVMQTQ